MIRGNQIAAEFSTVLRTKICVRVLTIAILAAAAALVVGTGVGAIWVVDDDSGADFASIRVEAAA